MANLNETLGTDIAHVNGDLVKSANGDQATISGLANLKTALFHRLITQPGSLVCHPKYGVGIMSYQNSPNSFTLQQQLANIIREQFALDVRVKQVTSVAIDFEEKNPQLTKIRVSVVPIGYTDATEMVYTPFAGGI